MGARMVTAVKEEELDPFFVYCSMDTVSLSVCTIPKDISL